MDGRTAPIGHDHQQYVTQEMTSSGHCPVILTAISNPQQLAGQSMLQVPLGKPAYTTAVHQYHPQYESQSGVDTLMAAVMHQQNTGLHPYTNAGGGVTQSLNTKLLHGLDVMSDRTTAEHPTVIQERTGNIHTITMVQAQDSYQPQQQQIDIGYQQGQEQHNDVIEKAPSDTSTFSELDVAGGGGGVGSPSSRPRGRPSEGGYQGKHTCGSCDKHFQNNSALLKHKLIHSEDRKYLCSVCNKGFKRQDHLTGHMNVHRRVKPFPCVVTNCDKSYCDGRSLRRHLEQQHHYQGVEVHSGRGSVKVITGGQVLAKPMNVQRDVDLRTHEEANGSMTMTAYIVDVPDGEDDQAAAGDATVTVAAVMPELDPVKVESTVGRFVAAAAHSEESSSGHDSLVAAQQRPLLITSPRSGASSFVYDDSTPPKAEANLIICNVCQRDFKNVPALNGHMRLHSSKKKATLAQEQSTGASSTTQAQFDNSQQQPLVMQSRMSAFSPIVQQSQQGASHHLGETTLTDLYHLSEQPNLGTILQNNNGQGFAICVDEPQPKFALVPSHYSDQQGAQLAPLSIDVEMPGASRILTTRQSMSDCAVNSCSHELQPMAHQQHHYALSANPTPVPMGHDDLPRSAYLQIISPHQTYVMTSPPAQPSPYQSLGGMPPTALGPTVVSYQAHPHSGASTPVSRVDLRPCPATAQQTLQQEYTVLKRVPPLSNQTQHQQGNGVQHIIYSANTDTTPTLNWAAEMAQREQESTTPLEPSLERALGEEVIAQEINDMTHRQGVHEAHAGMCQAGLGDMLSSAPEAWNERKRHMTGPPFYSEPRPVYYGNHQSDPTHGFTPQLHEQVPPSAPADSGQGHYSFDDVVYGHGAESHEMGQLAEPYDSPHSTGHSFDHHALAYGLVSDDCMKAPLGGSFNRKRKIVATKSGAAAAPPAAKILAFPGATSSLPTSPLTINARIAKPPDLQLSVNCNIKFPSQLRSPRNAAMFGANTLIVRDVSAASVSDVVPYTPPPILSPIRQGTGLFCKLRKEGIGSGGGAPKSAPISPSSRFWASSNTPHSLDSGCYKPSYAQNGGLISIGYPNHSSAQLASLISPHDFVNAKLHLSPKQVSFEPETKEGVTADAIVESDPEPKINIGERYQAQVPASTLPDIQMDLEIDKADLLFSGEQFCAWESGDRDNVRLYLENAERILEAQGIGNKLELSLVALHFADGNFQLATMYLMLSQPTPINDSSLIYDQKAGHPCTRLAQFRTIRKERQIWRTPDIEVFRELMLSENYKDFRLLSSKLGGRRSSSDCVEFYYLYKIAFRQDYTDMQNANRQRQRAVSSPIISNYNLRSAAPTELSLEPAPLFDVKPALTELQPQSREPEPKQPTNLLTKAFRCGECERSFNSENGRRQHVRRLHNKATTSVGKSA